MVEGASLNIALLPDDAIQRAAIAMSVELSKAVRTEFTLASEELIPHITLYQTAFPSHRLTDVFDAVAAVAAQTPAFGVRLLDVHPYKWTFLFWRCELGNELAQLHGRIVAATNHLRGGLVLPMLSATRPFLDAAEQSDVDAYGAVWIGPNYLPHITVSRIKAVGDVPAAVSMAATLAPRPFTPMAIVVGESRDHGTIGRILQRFDLTPSGTHGIAT